MDKDPLMSGFSIDDDEDVLPMSDLSLEDIPTDQLPVDALHPLHDHFLQSSATVDKTPPPPAVPVPVPAPVHDGGMHVAPFAVAATGNATESLLAANAMASSSATAVPSPGSAQPLDQLKAQTSRLASNLATMAQRGFHQVTGAASGVTALVPSPATVRSVATPAPTHLSTLSTAQLSSPQQQHPHSLATVDLDNEQKAVLVQSHVGDLFKGERVVMFLSNLLHVSDSTGFSYSHATQPSVIWCCAMTFYRLILFPTHPVSTAPCPDQWNSACWPPDDVTPSVLQIPLASIERAEKSVFTSTTTSNPTTLMGLLLHGKDNARQLRFTTPSYADVLRAHELLQTYAFPGRRNLGYLFAFESKREEVIASITTDEGGKKAVTLEPTRKRFLPLMEFQRQFFKTKSDSIVPWRVWSNVNQTYQICASYPSFLVGPASLDESNPEATRLINQCAIFRSENRLPALTWSSGIDGASLWRCSQPKVGLQGNRSTADELFLKHIMESAMSANAMADGQSKLALSRNMLMQLTGTTEIQNWIPEPDCGLKILDLRPRSAAMANRTQGYGYENSANYPGSTLQFCNIANIHAVRDAYQKLSALCTSPSTSDIQWHVAVEDTKWLSLVRLILSASWEAAFWIHIHRLPVLLHCSHGWDRTSQVAALTQILLDPYYRTREGFAVLVEKDFMSFGHPFHTRCGHGEGRGDNGSNANNNQVFDEGQISPIFLQFLDCVYQLVQQYPECFEFNSKYVLLISEHIYSCRFGNFLCDTERERELLAGIRQRTNCLWDYLDGRDDILSVAYSPSRAKGVMLMPLPTLLRNVTLWTDRHCMHGAKPTQRWLPAGISRPIDPYVRDQHSPLRTVEENRMLLMNVNAAQFSPRPVEVDTTFSIDDEE